jgi:hypothetical protein
MALDILNEFAGSDKEKIKLSDISKRKTEVITEGWSDLDFELSKILREAVSINDFLTLEKRLKNIPFSVLSRSYEYEPNQIVRDKESSIYTLDRFKIVDGYLIGIIGNYVRNNPFYQTITITAPAGTVIVAVETEFKTFYNSTNSNKITVEFHLDDFVTSDRLLEEITIIFKIKELPTNSIQLAIKYDYIYFPKSWYVIFADVLLTILKEYNIKCIKKPIRKYDKYMVTSGVGIPSNKLRSIMRSVTADKDVKSSDDDKDRIPIRTYSPPLDPWYKVIPRIRRSDIYEDIFDEMGFVNNDDSDDDEITAVLSEFKSDVMKMISDKIEAVICD